MIELERVTLRRGPRPILRELSLHLRPGEVTAILGPNGCGKSTLLSAIAGTLRYEGRIRLNGAEVARTPPERLAGQRAVLPQHSELAFAFRVAEVVAFGARGRLAADRPALAARIEALLAELGLAGFGSRNAMALSGGEAQRMHLARVLLQAECADSAPVWLFLDEPVSSLDLAHQLAVMDQARAFARRGGGVLAVLHDLNLAVRAADRLLVLHQGRVAADGSPAEVLGNGPVVDGPVAGGQAVDGQVAGGRASGDALLAQVFACAVPLNRVPAAAPFLLVQAAPASAGAGAGSRTVSEDGAAARAAPAPGAPAGHGTQAAAAAEPQAPRAHGPAAAVGGGAEPRAAAPAAGPRRPPARAIKSA